MKHPTPWTIRHVSPDGKHYTTMIVDADGCVVVDFQRSDRDTARRIISACGDGRLEGAGVT